MIASSQRQLGALFLLGKKKRAGEQESDPQVQVHENSDDELAWHYARCSFTGRLTLST